MESGRRARGNAVDILNYLKIDDSIGTSGQPSTEQFGNIAGAGFGTVINLALPSSDKALADEGAIVTGLGMDYFHIPVIWEEPQVDQFFRFASLMDMCDGEKVWVHCALNMRVSCFMYLLHRHERGMPEAAARALMNRIWDPEDYPAWSAFIRKVADEYPG